MTLFKVLHHPHMLLRKVSTPVLEFSSSLKEFTQIMIDTMMAYQGIGLAAPQVGVLKRITVVDVSPYLKSENLKEWHGHARVMVNSKEVPLSFPLVLINPVIVKKEQEGVFPLDGCLSLPGVSKSETKRFFSIQLEAYSPDRDLIQIETSGILSICLQHEIDHLDGILFVDRLIQPADKNEILADIQDFEEDPKERRKWKKLKTMDARAYVEAQSPRWT